MASSLKAVIPQFLQIRYILRNLPFLKFLFSYAVTILKDLFSFPGDEEPANGDMFLHGYPVQTYPAYRRRNIGYCPQTDVFFENLTCFEILMLSCRMRGIRHQYRKTIIAEILDSFNITRSAEDYPTNYSPSNKRKMSVLLSLIGNPPLVVIDEPTCNASSRAKKQIWACINSYR